MKNLLKITLVETRLFFREPASWIVPMLLPTIVLLVLGSLPSLRVPVEVFGGQRFIDVYVPSGMVITLATLGVNILPIRLTNQREKGVLRRLSTTPVHPALLLAAQLIINIVLAFAAVALLIGVGNLVFGVPLPRNGGGFLLALFLGLSSMLALGLLVAAVAPTARAGAVLSMPLYFLVMFLGGAYLPRVFLPDFLVEVSRYTPPGVQALLDAWMGISPEPLQIAVLVLVSLAAGLGAAKAFRWE